MRSLAVSISSARCTLALPGQDAWSRALPGLEHDFYHGPAYCLLEADRLDGSPYAAVVESPESTLLIPLVLRDATSLRPTLRDACSPYGYPGPIATQNGSTSASALIAAALDALVQSAVVSLFLRLHPLLTDPAPWRDAGGALVQHGQTIYIDLQQGADRARAQYRKGTRYDIRKLRAGGYRVAIDDWTLYSEFQRIYLDTMARLSAETSYFFGDWYFARFPEAVAGSCHLCTILAPDGCPAAAGLFTLCGGLAQYHLSGTHHDHIAAAPTKLMLDAMVEYLAGLGASVLHLGGGVGSAEDGLFRFKAGFSPLRAPFYTYRQILDGEAYADICRDSGVEPRPPGAGYFPAYREPR